MDTESIAGPLFLLSSAFASGAATDAKRPPGGFPEVYNALTLPSMKLTLQTFNQSFKQLPEMDMADKGNRVIIDLAKLNELNAEGCPACGNKFTLGETAVVACGAWEGGPKIIHENEAVWDPQTSTYVERRCYEARKGKTK
jgi:hypothetical protein